MGVTSNYDWLHLHFFQLDHPINALSSSVGVICPDHNSEMPVAMCPDLLWIRTRGLPLVIANIYTYLYIYIYTYIIAMSCLGLRIDHLVCFLWSVVSCSGPHKKATGGLALFRKSPALLFFQHHLLKQSAWSPQHEYTHVCMYVCMWIEQTWLSSTRTDPVKGLMLWDPAGLRSRAFAAGATGQALPYGIALQDLPACAAYCNLDIHIYSHRHSVFTVF